MSVDLTVASPAFLDMTFIGLDALPDLGAECYAGDLLRSPGGGAITAIGAARLGLRTALAAPLGHDLDGEFVRRALAREGIEVTSTTGVRTPTTAVLPWDGERAMVTYDPGVATTADDVARSGPRAVVASFDQLDLVPAGAVKYATCGDAESRMFADGLPSGLPGSRAVFVNQREAKELTGLDDPAEAMTALGDGVELVVLTLGADGAVALVDGTQVSAPGFEVSTVDTTGAGDLLCAAFVWADLSGADPETALRWAVLYSALSVAVPTGAAGAVTRAYLEEEATSRGLPPLGAPTALGEERRS